MNLRAIGNRLIVKPSDRPIHEGAIVVPDTVHQSRPMREGEVLSVGDGVRNVKAGDRVAWPTHEGEEIKLESGLLMALREEHVAAVLAPTVNFDSQHTRRR